jgi:hypothetical protein
VIEANHIKMLIVYRSHRLLAGVNRMNLTIRIVRHESGVTLRIIVKNKNAERMSSHILNYTRFYSFVKGSHKN